MPVESIILGGGCFWCTDAVFKRLIGVIKVTPGYAGGDRPKPTYETVCQGLTGQAEVVKIDFNPKQITLKKLLDVFWDIHDPTSLNKQGNDVGTQYRSIILYVNEKQKGIIKNEIAKISQSKEKPIVTEVKQLETFWPAEDYHYNYYDKNKTQPYCNLVIAPKLRHFEEKYKDWLFL